MIVPATAMISHSAQAEALLVLILCSHNSEPHRQAADSFKKYLEAHTSRVEFAEYSLDGNPDKAQEILVENRKRRPDLVYTLGSLAMREALKECFKAPVIAAMIFGSKELENAPNTTGVVLDFPVSIQLQWLRRFLPDRKKVGVLYNPQENQQRIDKMETEARKLGLELVAVRVDTPKELPAALKSIVRRADVLLGIPDKIVMSPRTAKVVLLSSFRNRIPFVGLSGPWVKAGALYALDRDYGSLGIQSGEIALRVLHGTSAGTIPLATPRKIVYFLNLKTAQHMKIEIEPKLVNFSHYISFHVQHN